VCGNKRKTKKKVNHIKRISIVWEDFMLVRNVERFLKEEKNQSTNVVLIQAITNSYP
jgi:hypothetical protein